MLDWLSPRTHTMSFYQKNTDELYKRMLTYFQNAMHHNREGKLWNIMDIPDRFFLNNLHDHFGPVFKMDSWLMDNELDFYQLDYLAKNLMQQVVDQMLGNPPRSIPAFSKAFEPDTAQYRTEEEEARLLAFSKKIEDDKVKYNAFPSVKIAQALRAAMNGLNTPKLMGILKTELMKSMPSAGFGNTSKFKR